MKYTADLFLVTFPNDYPWLPYLFRSIDRFVTGAQQIFVVTEEQDNESYLDALHDLGECESIVTDRCLCRTYRGTDIKGPWGQEIEKLRAFRYTDADRIVFIDSDCVFCRPIDLQTDPAINIDEPVVLYRPWESAGEAQKWKASTDKIMRYETRRETMCRHPACYPRWMLEHLWEYLGGEERIYQLARHPPFQDFNLMGNFALDFYKRGFTPVGYPGDRVAPDPMVQFLSRDGIEQPRAQETFKRLGLL